MSQLIKDYAEVINNQIKEIYRLKKTNDKMLEEFVNIEQILGKVLNYPKFKDDVVIGENTAWGLAMEAADRIKQLNQTCSDLRRELADPSPDIQEYVLRKLDLYKSAAESVELISNLKKENKELREKLAECHNIV